MEQTTLNDLNMQICELRKEMSEIKDILLEIEEENTDSLNCEIEEAKRGKSISHEEVVKRFCKN